MKAIKHLLAVSILAGAGTASAVTVYTTNLSGVVSAPDRIGTPNFPADGIFGTYAYVSPGAEGSANATGGIFNGVVQYTTLFSPNLKVNVGSQWTIDVAAHTATSLITSCTNLGVPTQCFNGDYPRPVGSIKVFSLDSYDFSNWTAHLTEFSTQLGTDVTITFSWSGSAVPVPASAWLFGSGLLGLAGTTKRRRVA